MAVIAISRQFGSGAEAIAHKVAEALRYHYVCGKGINLSGGSRSPYQ